MLLLWVVEARLRHQVQILLLAWLQPLLLVVDMAQTLLLSGVMVALVVVALVVVVLAMRAALALVVKVLLVVTVSLMVRILPGAVEAVHLPQVLMRLLEALHRLVKVVLVALEQRHLPL